MASHSSRMMGSGTRPGFSDDDDYYPPVIDFGDGAEELAIAEELAAKARLPRLARFGDRLRSAVRGRGGRFVRATDVAGQVGSIEEHTIHAEQYLTRAQERQLQRQAEQRHEENQRRFLEQFEESLINLGLVDDAMVALKEAQLQLRDQERSRHTDQVHKACLRLGVSDWRMLDDVPTEFVSQAAMNHALLIGPVSAWRKRRSGILPKPQHQFRGNQGGTNGARWFYTRQEAVIIIASWSFTRAPYGSKIRASR